MKKKLFLAAMLMGVGVTAIAQSTPVKNKNKVTITPEAGDWALGMNAAPILGYVGNMFNGTANNSVSTAFANGNNAIYGKYFVDANTAYRGSFRIASSSNTTRTLQDTSSNTNAPSYVENKSTSSGSGFVLSAGIEKRKGSTRIQGYYGGEVMLRFGAAVPNVKNEWAIALDSASNANGQATSGRTLSTKSGATFGFGLRGFIGVEYFVAPKLSIAGEFGYGISYSTTKGSESVTEVYGLATPSATSSTTFEVTTLGGKSSSFNLDTDNLGGAIRIMFHF